MSRIIYIFIMVLLVAVCGCSPYRHITTTTTDSVRVEYRTRVEYVPDTVLLEIPQQSERVTVRDTASHLDNDYAHSDARINIDGTLTHSLSSKPQPKQVIIRKQIEYRDSIIFRDRSTEKVVPVERELNKWQKMQIRGFWIALVLLIIIVRKRITSIFGKII